MEFHELAYVCEKRVYYRVNGKKYFQSKTIKCYDLLSFGHCVLHFPRFQNFYRPPKDDDPFPENRVLVFLYSFQFFFTKQNNAEIYYTENDVKKLKKSFKQRLNCSHKKQIE